MKPFAVFDIDGTIFRWQLYHELFDELYRRGIINSEDAEPVLAARDIWRNRQGTFLDYEGRLVTIMEQRIGGLSEQMLIEAADAIITLKGNQIYHYTTELLRSLKASGYTIVALSGSHHQIVERFAKLHGIDIAYGKQYDIKDGVLTGHAPQVYGRKAEILTQLVSEHGLSWDDSYAIGDSASDIDMLKLVAHPIAFNPDKGLYAKAREERWKIVIERKNIIYELEADGNRFILA